MGATFTRVKTWVKEYLKFVDLNAEFDNILNNLTPAGIDDLSANAGAMQGTVDPYPGGTASAATSLAGELQRMRYILAQITGETYWYIDPDATIASMKATLDNFQALGQWSLQADVPTHVSGTSFTVPTDLTAVYTAGRRTKCTVTAGTIYGTIISSAFTTVTTVTVINDSGALDSGISAVALGIITPGSNALPRFPVIEKVGDYTVDITDFARTINANKTTAINFTLPAANAVPTGWCVTIQNINAGVLTLTGTVNGEVNPTFAQYISLLLYSNGVVWLSNAKAGSDIASLTNLFATAGSLPYASAAATLGALAIGTAGQKLFTNAAGTLPEWSKGMIVKSFTRANGDSSQDVSYAGLGFKPSAMVVIAATSGLAGGRFSVGVTDFTTQGCVYGTSTTADEEATSFAYSNNLIHMTRSDGNSAVSKTADANGFTLTWTLTGSTSGTITFWVLAFM